MSASADPNLEDIDPAYTSFFPSKLAIGVGLCDPIWVNHSPADWCRPETHDADYELEEPADLYLFCDLSPDAEAKEGDATHTEPQHIRCTPRSTIDTKFHNFIGIDAWEQDDNYKYGRHGTSFLTYLRRTILEGGGFSGFVGEPKAEWFVKNVCHGLYPF